MAFISLLLTTAISSFSSLNYDGYFYQRENNNELLFLNNESSDSIENLISNNNIQTVATITVLVQGLNGSFVDYYHEIQGGYEIVENSIVDTLINGYRIDGISGDSITRGSNIYVFRNNEIRSLSNTSNTNLFSLSYIQPESIDISKPIILSYDGLTNQRSNEDCNNQFIDSLNRILVDIAEIQGGILPKINLIGYSRGGLMCIEYATRYPEIIQNLFTLGSPLCSSPYANMLATILQLIDENGESVYDEMLSYDYCSNLANRFNNISSYFNSEACGFSQTWEYLENSIDNLSNTTFLSELRQSSFGEWVLINAPNIIFRAAQIGILLRPDLLTLIAAMNSPEFIDIPIVNDFISLLLTIICNVQESFDEQYIETDVCVNLSSALGNYNGITYNFNNTHEYIFGHTISQDIFDAEHASRASYPFVAHNFITKYRNVASTIVSRMNFTGGFHKHIFRHSSDEYRHFEICECGAKSNSREHQILIDIGNEMTHTYHCSDSLCNYQRDEAHLFEYISFESEHIKSCVVCGLSEEETHSYNVFISSGTMRHNIYCVCGKYHSSARHTYYAGSLECVYCGQINGTGGGTNPITPPHIME